MLGVPHDSISEEFGMLAEEVEIIWKQARRKLRSGSPASVAPRERTGEGGLHEVAKRGSSESAESGQLRPIAEPQPVRTGGMDASALSLTSLRAARLYRLLTLVGTGPQTRSLLLRRLKLDVRGFYRDLEALRTLGIEVTPTGDETKYTLVGELDDALAKLPFPDPGLNVRDALHLANNSKAAHRKLKQRVNSFLNGPRGGGANKPR
jgi:hypothetical protein